VNDDGTVPIVSLQNYLSVRHSNTQSSILKTDIQYYDVTTYSLCKILLDRVVLKRCFGGSSTLQITDCVHVCMFVKVVGEYNGKK